MSNPQLDVKTAPVAEKILAVRAERLKTTPESAKRLFSKIFSGEQVSPRQRVKAFCLECVGFERAAITTCTSYACPLYQIRPLQKQVSLKSPL